MKRCVVVLAFLLAGLAPLRAADPLTVDWAGQIDSWTSTMVDQHINVFGVEGLNMLHSIAVILLVYMLVVGLISQHFPAEKLVQFILVYLFAYSLLQFYDSPLPRSGRSFHQLFADESRWISATLDLRTLDDLTENLKTLMQSMQHPGPLNIPGIIVYYGMAGDMSVIWFLSFGITAVGYVGTGCFSLVGPLCIPFLVWDSMSFIFWGWLRLMLGYAFIRAFASCILYVYAHVLMYFFNNVIANNFTLGHLAGIIWPFTALNLCFLFALAGSCIGMALGLFAAPGSLSSPFAGAARAISARIFS